MNGRAFASAIIKGDVDAMVIVNVMICRDFPLCWPGTTKFRPAVMYKKPLASHCGVGVDPPTAAVFG